MKKGLFTAICILLAVCCTLSGCSSNEKKEKAKEILKTITCTINNLCDNEEMGPEVARMFDIVTDYRYLVVEKNYVFYRIEEKYIRIVNLYHEKEDFMWQLFGVDTTPHETIDYWGE